jgi:ankyrin repeat protein
MLAKRTNTMKRFLPLCLWLAIAATPIWSQTVSPDTDPSAFFTAVKAGDLERMQAAMNSGVHIEARTPDGLTALMLAVECGQLNIVRELIERGADVNARIAHYGITALTMAMRQRVGDPDMIDLLLEAGAKMDTHDDRNNVPLTLTELP